MKRIATLVLFAALSIAVPNVVLAQAGEANVSRNHLTELLDFLGHGSYSELNLHRAGRQARVQGRAT